MTFDQLNEMEDRKPSSGIASATITEIDQGSNEISKGFEGTGICPQCDTKFDKSNRRAIQETCGHVKCRPCFIKNEDGCMQCKGQMTSNSSQIPAESVAVKLPLKTPSGSKAKDNASTTNNLCLGLDKTVILLEKQKTAVVKQRWTSRNKYLFKGLENKSKSKKHSHLAKEKSINQFKCDLCDKSYPTRSALEYHIRTHTGERCFPCKICDKSFYNSYELARHTFSHTGDSNFVCSVCEKKCITKNALLIHSRVHSNEKPFACGKCPKKYPSQASLNRHAVIHAETKDFLCNECGEDFTTKNALSSHIRSHLRDPDFPCDRCNSRFKKQIDLDLHQKFSHEEFYRIPCPLPPCHRQFRRKDNLIRHLKLSHDLTKEQANESLKSLNIVGNRNSLEEKTSEDEEFEDQTDSNRLIIDMSQENNDRIAALSINTALPSSTNLPNRNQTFSSNMDSEMYQVSNSEPTTNVNSFLRPINLDSPPPLPQEQVSNIAAATSVIRSVPSAIDAQDQYQQRQYDQVPQIATFPEPSYSNQAIYYPAPEMSVPEQNRTSLIRDTLCQPPNNSNFDFDSANLSSPVVIDNVTGSNLYLNIRYDHEYPYKEYLSPISSTPQPIPFIRHEYVPQDYRIAQEIAIPEYSPRSLLDLSSRNREVYSTYPDAIAVEQLNNQRVSPASRYPREQEVQIRRPENFTVIRKASASCRSENANGAKKICNDQFNKTVENRLVGQQESAGPDTNVLVANPREGRNTPSTTNRDPRKNFLWDFNRMNRD